MYNAIKVDLGKVEQKYKNQAQSYIKELENFDFIAYTYLYFDFIDILATLSS